MDKEKKKQIFLIAGCFIGAVLFFAVSVSSFFSKADNSKKNMNASKQVAIETKIKSTMDPNVTKSTESTKTNKSADGKNDSDYKGETERTNIYDNGFSIKGLNEEVLTLVDNDTSGMQKSVQKALFDNGFSNYKDASFEDYVEIDYSKKTVTINLVVNANKEVSMDVIYDRESKKWHTRIW